MTLFLQQSTPLSGVDIPGLTLDFLDIYTGRAFHDLTLELQDRMGRLVGWFEFDRDRFEPEAMGRIAGHFERLLRAAIGDPDRWIAELALLSQGERRQVVETWNATQLDYPREICVHHLIEAQAARRPGAVALVFEDQVLNYGELNARANRLAHRLRALGVGPDTLVGLCLDRSIEMVVGLLGVLKAGGAYVPLDPEYPDERLAFMVSDSGAPLLLTQRRHASRLSRPGGRVICLDGVDGELSGAPGEDPAGGARPGTWPT